MKNISSWIWIILLLGSYVSCQKNTSDSKGKADFNRFDFNSKLYVAPEQWAFYIGLKDNDINLFITYSLGLYPTLIDSNRVEEGRLIYTEELGGGIRDRDHYEYDSLNRLVAVSANMDISTYKEDITYTYSKDSFTQIIVSETYKKDTLLVESLIFQDSLVSEVNIRNKSNVILRSETYSYDSFGGLKSLILHSQNMDPIYVISFEYYDDSKLKSKCLVYLDDSNIGEREYTYYSKTQLIDSIVTVSCNEREVIYYAYNDDASSLYKRFLGK